MGKGLSDPDLKYICRGLTAGSHFHSQKIWAYVVTYDLAGLAPPTYSKEGIVGDVP